MSIIRAPRPEGNFYLLNKSISEDRRLSWAARGVLVFLLGKPDHWKVSPAHLRGETAGSIKPTGRDGIYGLLDELISAGYVRREQPRSESGALGEVTYLVSESPLPDSPYPAGQHTAEPLPANPTLVSIEGEQGLSEAARTEQPARAEKPAGSKGTAFDPATAKPENVSKSTWADWCQHRKEIRKPLTAKTCEQQARILSGHPAPDAVINQSISNGWTGLFPDKVLPGAGKASPHTQLDQIDYEAGLVQDADGNWKVAPTAGAAQ